MNNLPENNSMEPEDNLLGSPDNEADSAVNTSSIMEYIVWAITVLVAGVLFFLDQRVLAVAIVGVVAVIHGTFKPRVALYILLASIPLEWLIGINPEVTSITKLIAVWVLLVSLLKVVRAIFSGGWDPCAKWIVILVCWAYFSLLWAAESLACLSYLLKMTLLWGGIPLLICIHLDNRRSLQTGLIVFVVACFFSSIVFIMTGDVYSLTGADWTRATAVSLFGTTDVYYEANLFPRLFSLAVFACIYLIMVLKSNLMKLFFALTVLLMCIGILLAKGRIIYIAMPGALLAGVILLGGGGVSKRILFIIVISILVLGALFVASGLDLLSGGVQERFGSIFEAGAGSALSQRARLWTEYLEAFLSSGGLGKGLNQVRWLPGVGNVAHNDWIEIMGDLGLVGLIAFFGLHFCMFRRITRVNHIWSKMLCLTIWSFIILAALTQTDYLRKYYTMAIGLIIATVRVDESESADVGVESL